MSDRLTEITESLYLQDITQTADWIESLEIRIRELESALRMLAQSGGSVGWDEAVRALENAHG